MNGKPSTDVLAKIVDAFERLDFSQPEAHEVFRVMNRQVGLLICDLKNITDSEAAFYALGYIVAATTEKYRTTAPLPVVIKPSEAEKQ